MAFTRAKNMRYLFLDTLPFISSSLFVSSFTFSRNSRVDDNVDAVNCGLILCILALRNFVEIYWDVFLRHT